MTGKHLANEVSQLALEKKGRDVVIMDLQQVTDVADYFVLISCESDTHVKTILHHVEKALRDRGIRPWHKEGFKNLKWVLLDFVDVVVHIFLPDTRDYYGLERLWADAKMIKVDENATVRNISERTN